MASKFEQYRKDNECIERRYDRAQRAENIKEIYVGSIVMVKDSIGNCVPYINPKLDICTNWFVSYLN